MKFKPAEIIETLIGYVGVLLILIAAIWLTSGAIHSICSFWAKDRVVHIVYKVDPLYGMVEHERT